MTLILSGTDGLSDVDGSAATPAIRGTDANTGIFFPAADTIAFSEGGVEAMRINSSGNVGVGTSSPQQKLHVYNGASGGTRTAGVNTIIMEGSLAVGLQFLSPNTTDQFIFFGDPQSSQAGRIVYEHASNAMAFNTNATERARIDSSGNLLVGGTTARAAITIEKDGMQLYVGPKTYGAGAEGGEIQFGRGTDGASAWGFDVLNGASPDIRLINASAVGVQLVNGATAWSAYSDIRLKKNIAPLRSVLTDLQQIECINYHLLNADTEDTPIRVGVSAQSLVGKFDEVVDNFRMKGDTTDYLAVRYSDMVPYLVKAIQEQQAIIQTLTDRITALEQA
jgi:hypothetical protein